MGFGKLISTDAIRVNIGNQHVEVKVVNGVSIEFDPGSPGKIGVEGVKIIGGAGIVDISQGTIQASNISIAIPIPGVPTGEVRVKISPNGQMPSPSDPMAGPVNAAKVIVEVAVGITIWPVGTYEKISPDVILDPEVPGSPLSGGLLGEAYRNLRHRQREIDAQVDSAVEGGYRNALPRPSRDPLAIDLDGDGIETVGVATNAGPILFDHDANGSRTGTGWLKPDDGWLVRDLNGNGTIDSGRELFGVDTVIVSRDRLDDGSYVTRERNAYSGFDALRVLDIGTGANTAGYGDGLIDANDAAYAELKIWRDLNQDGISQPGELQSLAAAGIASISIEATLGNTDLGNGNTVSATATVTRTSGAQTQAAGVDLGTAGNLNLADNPVYRTFTDSIPLTEAAKALPEMGGSGWVRDLREAMSQSGGGALTGVVQQFAAAASRDAQMALIDGLLEAWAAGTGRLAEGSDHELVYGSITNETASSRTFHYAATDVPAGEHSNGDYVLYKFADGAYMQSVTDQNGFTFQVANAQGLAWLDRRNVLEVFNGQRFFTFDQTITLGGGSGSGSGGGGGTSAGSEPQVRWIYTFNSVQIEAIDDAYDALRESVYQALALQTRLAKYLDAIELEIDEAGIHFDTAPMLQLLQSAHAADAHVALDDLAELVKYAQPTLNAVGFDGMAALRTWVEALPSGSSILADLQADGLLTFGAGLAATAANDVYLGDACANQLNAGAGDDVLDGGAGNDQLSGNAGTDYLYGRGGDDVLNGDEGDDTLDGGAGSDTLNGGNGNNTYLFGKGDGEDVVRVSYDATAGKLNTLQFKSDVAPGEVVLKQVYDMDMGGNAALEFSIAGTGDKIVFDGFFYNNDPAGGYNSLQEVEFADGTTWDLNAITARLYAGTAGADTLTGTLGSDAFNGAAGADTLYGGAGNDLYLFGPGSGADLLNDYDYTAGNTDVLSVGAGVAADQIWLRRIGSDLEVSIIGTGDKTTIANWYSGSAYHVEQFKIADGKVLLDSQVDALVSAMAAFAPPAAGQTTQPAGYQSALNPVIASSWH